MNELLDLFSKISFRPSPLLLLSVGVIAFVVLIIVSFSNRIPRIFKWIAFLGFAISSYWLLGKSGIPTVTDLYYNFLPNSKIPSEMIEKTDRYMINQVGTEEFRENYKLDFIGSEVCEPEAPGCYVKYKFLPGDKYNSASYLLFISKDGIVESKFSGKFPSCQADSHNCNFPMELKLVKDVIRSENLNDDYIELIMWKGEIVVSASYCNLETTENRKKIYIDIQTGEIIWSGTNEDCIGII